MQEASASAAASLLLLLLLPLPLPLPLLLMLLMLLLLLLLLLLSMPLLLAFTSEAVAGAAAMHVARQSAADVFVVFALAVVTASTGQSNKTAETFARPSSIARSQSSAEIPLLSAVP